MAAGSSSSPQYWLLKTEPDVFSYDQLVRDGKTGWNGVRNFQARNFIRAMKKGDLALIYHTGDEKQVVGIAEVSREAYPDIDPEGGDWSQVDVRPKFSLKTPVTLAQLKKEAAFKDFLLLRQARLSVLPVNPAHWKTILKMGGIS